MLIKRGQAIEALGRVSRHLQGGNAYGCRTWVVSVNVREEAAPDEIAVSLD
jgi:hypothetical protein